MTSHERHITQAASYMDAAKTLIDKAVSETDPADYPMAFGLCMAVLTCAQKALSEYLNNVHSITEIPKG